MSNVFLVLMGMAALAVLASLFMGVFAMAKGSEAANKRSQKMMRARVILQGVAVLLFVLAMLSR